MAAHAIAQRWIGAKNLVADGVEHGSRVLERSQRSVAQRVFALLGSVTGQDRQAERYGDAIWYVLATAHRNVRLVSRMTSLAVDAVHQLAEPSLHNCDEPEVPVPLRSDVTGDAPWIWDTFLATVNGVIGDHLVATNNPLAIPMTLRLGDAYVQPDGPELAAALAPEPRRLCVLVHGLCATEWSWAWDAEAQQGAADINYGTLLAAEHGLVPLHVRYNAGRHISDNGRELADLLQVVVASSPHEINEISFLGHSMGGLVAQSAAYYGRQAGHSWVDRLKVVISLASPHDGAPLEKLGNIATSLMGAVDTPGTRVPAEVIDARSAGIKDLRRGRVIEEDWRSVPGAKPPSRWIDGVSYHRVVATLAADPESALGRLVGDAMVRPESAAASAAEHGMSERPGEVAVVGGISHVGLSNHPRVYGHIRRWLAPEGTEG